MPPAQVQVRGRGATTSGAGLDRRFAEDYDPKLDLAGNDDNDGDEGDYEDELQMRMDRAQAIKLQAERLRSAGFTEEQIENWTKGKEAEVKYGKKGETREWDRGKTMLEDDEL